MFLLDYIKTLLVFFLTVGIVTAQLTTFNKKSDTDSHLTKYSHYNVTHHDNIDDEPHAHTHKHSEDGDEHEHSHEHSKVTQSEIKLLNHSVKVLAEITIIETNQGFIEKNLISSPHPSEVYRPPILI
tara:strand:+ start:475 stop:855 length:381 start_codon:yes stop_codon:yes gene_type:complete